MQPPPPPPPSPRRYLPWYLAEEAADNAGIPKLPEIRKRRRRRRQKKKSGVKSGPVQRMMAVLFEHVSTQPQPLYIFRKMDQDKSGELDRSEFAKAIMSMGTGRRKLPDAFHRFARVCRNQQTHPESSRGCAGEKLSDAHMEELMNLMDAGARPASANLRPECYPPVPLRLRTDVPPCSPADQNGTVSLKEFLDRLKMHHMESIRAKLQAAYTGGEKTYESPCHIGPRRWIFESY